MKILLIADLESTSLWDYYTPEKLQGYDMIISAGDLKSEYLTFLVTLANVPLLYVHGNHDEGYETRPPEGCECVEDKIVKVNGLRILGLGGANKYKKGPHQYTERQMRWRIFKLKLKLLFSHGVDIVVTHAPPAGYGDGEDYAHRGFKAFLPLMKKYRPKYLVHGHTHLNYFGMKPSRVHTYEGTTIINAYEKYDLTIE